VGVDARIHHHWGSVFAEFERNAAGGSATQWQADLITYLTGVIATGRYPHLASALATSAAPADADTLFARSLDRVITLILMLRE